MVVSIKGALNIPHYLTGIQASKIIGYYRFRVPKINLVVVENEPEKYMASVLMSNVQSVPKLQ